MSRLYPSLLKNNWISLLPKGKAWCGENTRRFFDFILDFYKESLGKSISQEVDNYFLSSADNNAKELYFRDFNLRTQAVSFFDGDKTAFLSIALQKKRYVTIGDWEEIASTLGMSVEVVRGEEAFNDPSLVAPVAPPTTIDNAQHMLYIRITDESSADNFPYEFPILFGKNISPSDLFNVYRKILDTNIELRIF